MTDLISLADIQTQLQSNAETFVDINVAYRIVQQAIATYEADRVTGQQLVADFSALVADCREQIATLTTKLAVATADVHVTVGTASPKTSAFSTAVSHVSTNDLLLGDATARARAEVALTPALTYHRVSCHSYGGGDPWAWNGTGTRPVDPTNWTNVDNMLAMVARMNGVPIMGFGNWPWHVRGRWNGKATTPCTVADQLLSEGRPITEKIGDVLHFVECVCKRYLVAPYAVRYWQLGGWEFHGMELGSDGTYNNWAYDAYAGSPGQADMGMAYLHNQVSAKLIAVAQSLGIPRSQLKIITNYPPMVAYGAASGVTAPVGHALYGKPWGAPDKRPIAALLGMLPLLTPGSFDYWSYDQTSRNKDGIVITDDWTNSQRFTDMGEYLKQQVAALGFGSVPFIVSEQYNKPQADPGPNQQQQRATLHAEALRRFVLLGASMAITWSTVGRANDPGATAEAGLHTSVATATGGQPQPALNVLQAFHDHFSIGTTVYPLSCSDARVDGLASDATALLYNKTPSALKVALGEQVVELDGYGVEVVQRVSAPAGGS